MAVNKVVYFGEVLVDMSQVTVNPEKLVEGETALDASGELITGNNPYEKAATDTEVGDQSDLLDQAIRALQGKAAGSGGAVLQDDKEVTPSEEEQIVFPDDGFDGMSQVTVKAIPEDYIVPHGEIEITENGTYDVTGYASAAVNVAQSGGDFGLPAGYSRVDYIQFSGKQVVDTGVICNQNTKIYANFTRDASTQEYLYGVASSRNTASVTAYLGGSWRFGNKAVTKSVTTVNDKIGYGALVDKSQISISGSIGSISGVNDFETIGSLLLGSCRSASGAVGAAQFDGKILFFNMWQGEEPVLKLKPVVSADGVYRFYDTVSGEFFDSITDTPLDGGIL